eukprot:GHVH01000664.1.p1 GENE.GHVH01000664.1~~GHVH01000664.1.p1  ORF type:complete len:376 (-),score=28.45 GHVH01000664.1:188-1315(-)
MDQNSGGFPQGSFPKIYPSPSAARQMASPGESSWMGNASMTNLPYPTILKGAAPMSHRPPMMPSTDRVGTISSAAVRTISGCATVGPTPRPAGNPTGVMANSQIGVDGTSVLATIAVDAQPVVLPPVPTISQGMMRRRPGIHIPTTNGAITREALYFSNLPLTKLNVFVSLTAMTRDIGELPNFNAHDPLPSDRFPLDEPCDVVVSDGTRCFYRYCHTLDFLPFICKRCQKPFCLDHSQDHNCSGSGREDRRLIKCVHCSKMVEYHVTDEYREQERIDDAISIHSKSGQCITKSPSDHSSPSKTLRCPVSDCREKLYLSNCLECRTCKTKYCLKHRYPNTHSCTGNPAGNPAGKSTGMNAFLQSLHITFKKKKKK